MNLDQELQCIYKPFITLQRVGNKRYNNGFENDPLIMMMVETTVTLQINGIKKEIPIYNDKLGTVGKVIRGWFNDIENYVSVRGIRDEDVKAIRFTSKAYDFELALLDNAVGERNWYYTVGNYHTVFDSLCKELGYNTEIPYALKAGNWQTFPRVVAALRDAAPNYTTVKEMYQGLGIKMEYWCRTVDKRDEHGETFHANYTTYESYHRYITTTSPNHSSIDYSINRIGLDVQSAVMCVIHTVLLQHAKGHEVTLIKLGVVKDNLKIATVIINMDGSMVYVSQEVKGPKTII